MSLLGRNQSRTRDESDDRVIPVISGAYAIIGKMLHFNPTKRISLRDLRQAVLTLDTFSRSMGQCEHVVHEHEHTTIPSSVSSTIKLGTSQSQLGSTIMAPEIDILDAASGPVARVAQDCSAGSNSVGSGPDAKGRNENVGAVGACSRASSGQTSKSSTMVATPEDSEVVMAKREVGYRIKSIVSRVKRKLRYHS